MARPLRNPEREVRWGGEGEEEEGGKGGVRGRGREGRERKYGQQSLIPSLTLDVGGFGKCQQVGVFVRRNVV